jgi:hypothetical protein
MKGFEILFCNIRVRNRRIHKGVDLRGIRVSGVKVKGTGVEKWEMGRERDAFAD